MMKSIRKFMNIIVEKYTPDNKHLFNYLKNREFDPYAHWQEICQWLEDTDNIQAIPDAYRGDIETADELFNEDADIFYHLPPEIQEECEEAIIEELMQQNPVDAPTWSHMDVRGNNVLHRQTWLVHFTDKPYEIATEGFKFGIDRMDRLALTSWIKDTSDSKKYGGYNFAFEALSKDAANVALSNKYGRHAILFQNSGVKAYHHGDEESQIMFWGKDVDPRDIIILKHTDYGWKPIMWKETRNKSNLLDPSRGDGRGDDLGDYQKTVEWVIKNFHQYRKFLTRR